MNGIHDMGGMDGFGTVEVEPNEPVFHQPWEGRVFALAVLAGIRLSSVDTFRHAVERLDPVTYLTTGYYGRWLEGLETVLVEAGILPAGEVDARLADDASASLVRAVGPPPTQPETVRRRDAIREVDVEPRFAVGQRVRTRNRQPKGHTRLPRYARGRAGTVARVCPAFVFSDTNAHRLGEDPQYVYAVRFTARELWGEDADSSARIHLDLFESYLESI